MHIGASAGLGRLKLRSGVAGVVVPDAPEDEVVDAASSSPPTLRSCSGPCAKKHTLRVHDPASLHSFVLYLAGCSQHSNTPCALVHASMCGHDPRLKSGHASDEYENFLGSRLRAVSSTCTKGHSRQLCASGRQHGSTLK